MPSASPVLREFDSIVLDRLAALVDPGSLRLDAADLPRVSSAAKAGSRASRRVLFATEPSRQAGALSPEGCRRIVRLISHGVETGRPVVGVWHSGGALR